MVGILDVGGGLRGNYVSGIIDCLLDNSVDIEYCLGVSASCAIPIATRRPILFNNGMYFDGGVSDPIPYKKAFEDGCDKLIVCLTLPVDYKKSAFPKQLVRILLPRYPQIAKAVAMSHIIYNDRINEILKLEEQGKVLILSPKECFGIKTATRDKVGLNKLYELGYKDAERIKEFLR